jgi:Type II secretion system (T2SS), protein E, N-terminal domain
MKKHEAFVEALCSILIKNNIVSAAEAVVMKRLFKDRSSDTFDDFLLSEGLVEKHDLLNALSEYYRVPAFDVVGYFFEHALLHAFPKEFLYENAIIPLEVDDESILLMIAADPHDENLLPAIGNHVSYDVQFMVGIRQDIEDAIDEFYDQSLAVVDEDSDLDAERRQRDEEKELEEGEEE